jgi:Ca2+-binding EF-hand superfamily protein
MSEEAAVKTECEVPVNVPRKLSPEEAEQLRREALEVFDLYDVDKSGYVDATEVENLFRGFNTEGSLITFTEEELKELGAEFMKIGDANGDGKVTFDEFFKAILKDEGVEVEE